MHIRLIETGYKPRRLSFDVSGPLEDVTRRIIDDFFKYDTSAYITAIRFTKFDAVLYEDSGAVFVQLKDAAAYDLREKLATIYPALK